MKQKALLVAATELYLK